MSRDIDSGMLTPILSNNIRPCFLAKLAFKSQTIYCWTGTGTLVYGGNNYLGVGDFGQISPFTEGTDVQAYAASISLSGIDPDILSECLTDIQLGAPATIYFACLDQNGSIYGTPYPCFVGQVDKPSIMMGLKTVTISLALENKLANLQRASLRRYTSADQQLYFPGDTFFFFVEQLNDLALRWTS